MNNILFFSTFNFKYKNTYFLYFNMNELHNNEQALYTMQLKLLLILCAFILYFYTYNFNF